jgi:protein-glutamine gamma-glutamyltransferase
MSFDHALRLTSILLASASFIGLALGASLPEWLVLLTGSVLILVLLRALGVQAMERLAHLAAFSTATWNILLILGFTGFWMDALWISGEFLPAGIHFLLVLMVIKLCNLQTRRDYLHLYAISLMAIVASAALTTDLWYLPIFLAYLLTGVWTLLLFQLTKKSDDTAGPPSALSVRQESLPAHSQVTPQLFWLANGLAAVALCLTLIIFFAIPRVSAGLFQKGYGDSIRTSGFSDTVDLGAIGPIKRDPSIVMRVELPDRSTRDAGRLYLRGAAYDRYDGTSWTNQLTHRRTLPETAPMTFSVRPTQPRGSGKPGVPIRQNILLEPLDTAVLFAAPFAESVSGRFLTVQVDAVGVLALPFPSASRIEYSVLSRTTPLLPADLQPQSVSYPESFVRHFLQAPGQVERIAALALTVTQDKSSRYEKALAIEKYLSTNFRYSLDVPLSDQAKPIDEFLFTRKTGYCEHYATAMVLMLRTIGIPARLVTGFLATEWNEYGNYYVVRQQDAHAWVELHLPHSGWVMMDPTPAVTETVSPPGWQALSRIMDSFRLRWNRFFVQYSAADQLAVVRELKAGGASVRTRAWDSLTALLNPVAAQVGSLVAYAGEGNLDLMGRFLGLALAGLGIIIWLAWKRPWKGLGSAAARREDQMITRLYKAMLRHLARNGLNKPAASGPIEFQLKIQHEWADAGPPVAIITDLYCRGRFGAIALTEEDLIHAQRSLQILLALDRL